MFGLAIRSRFFLPSVFLRQSIHRKKSDCLMHLCEKIHRADRRAHLGDGADGDPAGVVP